MRTLFASILVATCLGSFAVVADVAHAMDACRELPPAIKVHRSLRACGGAPAVVLKGRWKDSFSAAFRWDDGSKSGQDRSPFALNDARASASPYKTQRRIRAKKKDTLCYGKFLKRRSRFPVPEQLTIKRTAAPRVARFCVAFE